MKFKISNSGILEIERAGMYKDQICFMTNEENCGDYCSLFGEPERKELELHDCIELELCCKTLICKIEDFKDERSQANGN